MSGPPKLDAARAGGVRRQGSKAVDEAYRRLFDTPDGHVVLIDLLVESGVTTAAGPGASDAHLRHVAGASALALKILKRAGYDGQAVAGAMISDSLRGLQTDAHADEPQPLLPGHPDGPPY